MPDFEYVVVSPVGDHGVGDVLPDGDEAVVASPHCFVRRAASQIDATDAQPQSEIRPEGEA